MKKTIFTLVVFSLLTLPFSVFADDGETHSGGKCDPAAGCTPPPTGFASTPDNGDGEFGTLADTVLIYLNGFFK